jgi:hypothetical protein
MTESNQVTRQPFLEARPRGTDATTHDDRRGRRKKLENITRCSTETHPDLRFPMRFVHELSIAPFREHGRLGRRIDR